MHATWATTLDGGGWGLQVLSVILKSLHLRPTFWTASLILGTYSSGSDDSLRTQQAPQHLRTTAPVR